MTDRPSILTNEEFGARFLREGIAARAKRLRDLADRIEREGEAAIQAAEARRGTYGRAAANVLHEITWGVANLNLETLMSTATDADIARAEGS